ncbi:hypothetical protein FSP39_011379 [Pinctada imbricata]|uniref:DDE Tnp4 domain-containing protein n=2 Tax=Pinctada imbricata TaxID=66713 RepID=A0AA89BVR2_PINIB|nr:hypothetical protein FSP39_011379 [Pinctada imbricata]
MCSAGMSFCALSPEECHRHSDRTGGQGSVFSKEVSKGPVWSQVVTVNQSTILKNVLTQGCRLVWSQVVTVKYQAKSILEKISPVLKYWRGRGTTSHQTAYQRNGKQKTGPQRKLTSFHEFLITLLRIKLALPTNVRADIFGTSNTRISQIFSTWTNFMSAIFSSMLKWPNSKKVKKHMPSSFRSMYPKTTCIIDCTEFHIEKPATPTAQAKTYSTYKSRNTFKALVSVTPSGAFSYISNLWGGNVSDRFITEHCGFLDHIRKGDEVMADRGFIIRDLLLERGASLNIPPFTKKCSWGKGKRLTAADIKKTRKIAKLRIHVERAIGRLKNYRILSNTLPLKLKPLSNQIVKISAFLCNLQPPLVKQ